MKELEDFIIEYLNNKLKQQEQTAIEYLVEKRKNWLKENTIEAIEGLKDKISHLNNAFDKDVHLKFIINEILKDNKLNKKKSTNIHQWIVGDWGGIKTHKNFETIYQSMETKSFDRISSWSKIASFEDIKNDVIYDSRVIYSLNWIIFLYNKKYSEKKKYFLQPSSRNKLITLLPVDSIISFDNTIFLNAEKKIFEEEIYIDKSQCYAELCKIVKKLNDVLFKVNKVEFPLLTSNKASEYPFFTEMLLFQIADDIIFKDIKESIKISLK